jgi:hypothetical protein
MAISAVNLGTNCYIGIGASGQTVPSGTFVEIGGIYSSSMSVSHDAVDTTNNDDAGFTSAEYGNSTVTLSFECRFDPTDTAQGTLRTIAADLDGSCKVKRAFAIRPIVGSGEDSWSFEGVITKYDVSFNNNEPVNISVEVQSSGAVTYSTQT